MCVSASAVVVFAVSVSASVSAVQITPLPAVFLAVLVCVAVNEPPRGHTEGVHTSKGVQGESGFLGYLKDLKYCFTK